MKTAEFISPIRAPFFDKKWWKRTRSRQQIKRPQPAGIMHHAMVGNNGDRYRGSKTRPRD